MKEKYILIFIAVFAATAFTMGALVFRKSTHGTRVFSSLAENQKLEDQTWVLLLNPPAPDKEQAKKIFGTANEIFAELLINFAEFRIPPGYQNDFFQKKIAPSIKELCKTDFFSDSVNGNRLECDTGHLISQMAVPSEENRKLSTDDALPFLKFQSAFDKVKDPLEEIKYLENQEALAKPKSLAMKTLKTARARIAIKMANFKEASAILKNEISDLTEITGTVPLLRDEMKKSLCQSQALASCDTSAITVCAEDDLWKEWSEGCTLKKAPTSEAGPVKFLGYWWNQSITRNQVDFDKWESTKPNTQKLQDLPLSQTKFVSLIFDSLDFVLSVKAEVPRDLIERANKISYRSPLWVWAQKQALKEFGSQWAALRPKPEQKIIAYFNLLEKGSERGVASESKSKKLHH